MRKALLPNDRNPYLLAGTKHKGLSPHQIRTSFHKAVKNIGIVGERKNIANTTFGAPVPHSLRHSYAINTLKHVRQQGKSPQNALPVLATYMGHSEYKHTLKYLKVLDAGQRQELLNFVTSKGTI